MATSNRICRIFVMLTLGLGMGAAIFHRVKMSRNEEVNISETSRSLPRSSALAEVPKTLTSSSEESIMLYLESINNAIQTKYRLQRVKSHDIHTLQTELGVGYISISKLAETNVNSASEFVTQLLNHLEDMKVPGNATTISRITKMVTNSSVSESGNYFNSMKWASVFLPAKYYIFDLNNFYTFLLNLNRKLSEYSFQRDSTKYNVNEMRNWGVGGHTQGIHISGENLKIFLQKVGYHNVAGFKLIRASNVDDVFYRDLNRILGVTLKSHVEQKVLGNELIIQGRYVVISKFIEVLNNKTYNSVKIFALNTVFIDADIERIDKDFQMSIVAPIWDVQGTRKIVLKGSPGESLDKAKRGKVGTSYRAGDGEDGRPGNSGFSGGSFFGIGQEFLRGERLTVSSRGGQGGRGQDGGDGEDGQRQNETNHEATLKDICPFRYPMPKQYEFISTERNFFYDGSFLKVFPSGAASGGGNGGSGGVGGVGGRGGEVSIVHLGGESRVRRDTSEGSDGAGGLGGEGGKAGYVAKTLIVYMKTVNCGLLCYSMKIDQCDGFVDKELDGKELSNGLKGVDNYVTVGRLPPNPVQELSKSKVINMFKSFSWSNMKSVVTFLPLSTFLENLHKNINLRSSYDLLSFVDELKRLDSANYEAGGTDLSIYYRYILESLVTYLKSSSKLNVEEMKVLKYVYAATLSKICRMRTRSDRSLITDLSLFLQRAKSNLPKLEDLKTYQETDSINVDYENNIEIKIKEANEFIKNHTLVELDNVIAEINANILTLENETKTLKQSGRVNADAMLQYERELLGNKIIRWALASLRVASTVMLVLVPTTKVVASLIVVSAAAGVSSNGVLQTERVNGQTYPQGLTDAIVEMKMMSEVISNERKLENFINLTDRIIGEIGFDCWQLNRFMGRVLQIKSDLTGRNRPFSLARDDLRRAIHLAEMDLHPDDVRGNEKLGIVRSLFYESDSSLKILAKYQTKTGRESIGPARLKEADEKINELLMYEDQIKDVFVPLLSNIEQSLTNIGSRIANRSHFHLDVGRWQVQNSIRNVKHFMRQMTRGFHIGHKFERTISKLEESADLIINLYDRIEIYQEEKQMADLVSSINKAKDQSIPIKDPILKAVVTELQLTIASNNIITQCSRAMSAFKQQIFPFVNSYLHLLNDDLSSDRHGNISQLVIQSEEKLQILFNVISETESSVQTVRDTNVITKIFSSNYLTSQPFFTWQNDIFNEEINNFLSGEEVVMKAEITIGSSENAVKFSIINLNIKATNELLQVELEDSIKHFDVQMKHFGNSHYRCGDQFFVIRGESQTFSYSYENYNSTVMTPTRNNQIYKKIKAGDISLSPYAMWSLKLESITGSFETLNRFKGNVSLELVGEGQYVKENDGVCEGQLDDYYELYQDYI